MKDTPTGQKLIFTAQPELAIDTLVAELGNPDVYVLVDENTESYVLPILQSQSQAVGSARIITTPASDTHKTLDALVDIWRTLTRNGATRRAVLVNVGGGMVTDLGGFAASTFKRGIRFINVPTTLLGAVDASVGGKTGINFDGYKNEIGAFNEAVAVVITTQYFNTLPQQQMLSGYAEMLKHGLLEDRDTLYALMHYDITHQPDDPLRLLDLLQKSVLTKQRIVSVDPKETGLRKALNLGHTIGHAFESFALEHNTPIPHGYAVAWGLVVELVLSHMQYAFPSDILHDMARYVKDNYGAFAITCDDYPRLLDIMSHDKKNASADTINFTLLANVGDLRIDSTAGADDIKAALDIYRDLMGL